MNILIIHNGVYTASNATTSRMHFFARGMKGLGASVYAIGATWSKDGGTGLRWDKDKDGTPYTLVSEPGTPSGLLEMTRRYFRLPNLLCATLEAFLRDQPVDVALLYGQSGHLFGPLVPIFQKYGVSTVVDCNEWQQWSLNMRPIMWPYHIDQSRFRRMLSGKFSGILGIAQPWEEFARSKGVPAIVVPAIGDCVAPPDVSPKNGDRTTFRLTYLGPMSFRDLPDTMLEGIRRIVRQGIDVRLVVVGAVAKYVDGRRSMRIVENDPVLKPRVTFTGWVSDEEVWERLHQTDALVLLRADNHESRACFPTRLPQYLLSGKPVILSDVGDPPRYFKHGQDAWILPPGDRPQELAEAVSFLASHPLESTAIGKAGQETAIREFSYLKHSRRLMEFFYQVRELDVSGARMRT